MPASIILLTVNYDEYMDRCIGVPAAYLAVKLRALAVGGGE
jgi:hypothetical protein